jgi:hypothetical protein
VQRLPSRRRAIEQALGNESLDSIIAYVTARRNADGGYTFARGTDSNSLDTYFGLAILRMLEHPVEDPDKTAEWLDEFRVRDLRSAYYVTSAYATLLNEGAYQRSEESHQVTAMVHDIYRPNGYFGSYQTHPEAASEFETNSMAVELAGAFGVPFDRDRLVKNLMSTMNPDGGFGLSRGSDIISTYHIVSTVATASNRAPESSKVQEWIVSCENPAGGFPVRPSTLPSCMEYTYSGIMALSVFDLSPKFPSRMLEFVKSCQKNNGGFGRSEIMGIPTFEHTFQAIRVIGELARL